MDYLFDYPCTEVSDLLSICCTKVGVSINICWIVLPIKESREQNDSLWIKRVEFFLFASTWQQCSYRSELIHAPPTISTMYLTRLKLLLPPYYLPLRVPLVKDGQAKQASGRQCLWSMAAYTTVCSIAVGAQMFSVEVGEVRSGEARPCFCSAFFSSVQTLERW